MRRNFSLEFTNGKSWEGQRWEALYIGWRNPGPDIRIDSVMFEE